MYDVKTVIGPGRDSGSYCIFKDACVYPLFDGVRH